MINVQDLSSGVYILKIREEENTLVTKLIR